MVEAQVRVPRHVQVALRDALVVPLPSRHGFGDQGGEGLGHLSKIEQQKREGDIIVNSYTQR